AQNPPSVTGSTSYNSIVDNASGSDKGKQIAKYALQFVGNPYVAGGTSLTNGADCSGFTYRVYQDWGYGISRTSYSQRSDGRAVDYSEAQPGDLICYEGHVALYIGGGKIVHASTQRTGIKVSNANYRPIVAVRRII
ncbi:MAG: C40 family peptidase, partial [Acetatifactor sp.]|nr:C40 family peptidase [Acetatifactor sp.]